MLVFMVLLWEIPDCDPRRTGDRVSLIVSTRMGERLPVLRSGVSGAHCCGPWSLWSASRSGVPCAGQGCISLRFLLGLSGAASRWLGHCLRLGTSKHGRVSGTSYFLKLFSRLRWVGRDAPQTL